MLNLIVLLWLVASAYVGISIIRPLRPFRVRWHAAVALAAVQVVCVVAAVPFSPPAKPSSPPPAAKVTSSAQSADVRLVKIDPNAPVKPVSAAARADAAKARSEMTEQLRLIDAAETLLGSALKAGNREAVELVRRDMQQLDVKLIQRRPPFGSDPWPVRAEEGHMACETAAHRLSMIAAGALERTSLEIVAAQQRFGQEYISARDQCSAWVRQG